jgi:hypothetical protein
MSDPAGSRASRRAARRAGPRNYPPRELHLIDVENPPWNLVSESKTGIRHPP